MPVHINLQLYGWCSLPLVAFLFRAYGADRGRAAQWCRPVLWMWSASLAVATLSWLDGQTSGKLFLDWTGYARVLFPASLLAFWGVLALALREQWSRPGHMLPARIVKAGGLVLLLPVPVLLYVASSPAIYPPINPDSGGPTGASQLESVLVIVAILLLVPHGVAPREPRSARVIVLAWSVFALEALLCLGLGPADVSHHRPVQFLSLASLLVWIGLVPAYYRQFAWHPGTRRWKTAMLVWWAVLVPTGWCLFLPGVLDHFKFTDGLVGHSLLAMGGFASSLLILVLVQLLGEDGWIFNGDPWFFVWQFAVAAYVVLMFACGWAEGSDPSFSFVPGALREWAYGLRLLLGVLMLVASVHWLMDASKLMRGLSQKNGQEQGARAA